MARPLRIIYPGAYYHITSRGNEQKEVFKSRKDREKFLEYLSSATERYGAQIHVYCLMSNHYHLLLETPAGNVSQIMRHINGAYTTYFNVKRKRVGHLFQGRYKAILVEADTYAVELSRYIHLNPVRAGIVDKPEDYAWSSYPGYIEQNPEEEWLKSDFILGYFGTGNNARIAYRSFVEDSLVKAYENPLQRVKGSAILGTDEFLSSITTKYIGQTEPQRDVPALRQLIQRPSPETILSIVESALGFNKRLVRQTGMYLCHRFSGAKVREIGEMFKVGPSAVTEASRLFSARLKKDGALAEKVSKILMELGI